MLNPVGFIWPGLSVENLMANLRSLAGLGSFHWPALGAGEVARFKIHLGELKASAFPTAFTLFSAWKPSDRPSSNALSFWERFFWTTTSFTAFGVILFLTTTPLLVTLAVGALMLSQHNLCSPVKSLFNRWRNEIHPEYELGADEAANRMLDLSKVDQAEIEKLVFDAIQSIYPTANLAGSPLLYLRAVERRLLVGSPKGHRGLDQPRPLTQQRANELSKLLIELIDGLKDGLEPPKGKLSDDWGPYASLRFYVLRQQGFRTSSEIDPLAIEWRRLKQKSYNAKLKEYEAIGVGSIARSIRELNERI